MTLPLMTFVWQGGAMHPLGRFAGKAADAFTDGETYTLEPHEARSHRSHAHYFAMVHDYWLSLPESAALEPWAVSAEHLRKYALIRTGWADCTQFPVSSKAEAQRTAVMARAMVPATDYQILVARGDVVERYVAKSQSMRAMGKEAFQRSKDDVLGFLSSLVSGENGRAA